VLAGRSLSSLAQTRPSSSLQDYLDSHRAKAPP